MFMHSPYIDDKINLHQLSVLRYGKCTLCGKSLVQGARVYTGKMNDGSYAIACDACKDRIDTPSSNYVFYRQEAEMPNKDVKLWRYQDFSKFVSLLDSGKLFFTRADSFDDPFECAKGFNFQKDAIYAEMEKYLRIKVTTDLNKAGNKNPSDDEINTALKQEMDELIKQQGEKRKAYFVSCWHENERESEGMWKLYTSALSEGVAVQTTVERLCRSLKNDVFEIGKVNYVSYDKPLTDKQVPVWYKRDGFAHEKEVRVVIKDATVTETGMPVAAVLDTLIEAIYVSPTTKPWLADLVRKVTLKYGLDKPVNYSQLNETPVY